MERVTGIWLDLDHAYIYHLQKGKNEFQIIDSGIEHFNPVGGARSSTPYGAQEAVSEKHFLERKKHQAKNYYDRITLHLKDSQEVVVIGPAEAKTELHNHLGALNNSQLKLHPPLTKDSMTENQLKATIRDYYKSLQV